VWALTTGFRRRALPPPPAWLVGVAVTIVATTAVALAAYAGSRDQPSAAPRATAPAATATPAVEPSLEAAPEPTRPTPALTAALDEVWRDTPGGCLRVTAGERVLYEVQADRALAPASVTKLVTATAALEVLGAETRLQTTVRAGSAPDAGVVAGDLWLVGGGDPVLGTDAWAARLAVDDALYTSLDTLADQVVAAGVRRIEGRILGDETRYDSDRYVDTWPDRLIADGEAGPLSALTVNDGFRVWGHPGVPFADPPADAAALFTELLVARGVSVAATPTTGAASSTTVELAGMQSPPVGDLVHAMLRDSDNGTAELLLKEVGLQRAGDGSTAAGAHVARQLLDRDSVPLDGVTIADGSGLSDAARLTCRAVTSLLAARSTDLAGRLSVAGRDGTLARRFRDTPVAGRLRAKSGSIDGVAALAGYASSTSGTPVVFAYLIQGLPHGESARFLQDSLAAALVGTAP
jgi:D-alanyl-D-alanine carboxypeptidase/D-alanyl-D-alanine-endopeptidase (penicillin-binding protein 4)